jgi:hypothetical protein
MPICDGFVPDFAACFRAISSRLCCMGTAYGVYLSRTRLLVINVLIVLLFRGGTGSFSSQQSYALLAFLFNLAMQIISAQRQCIRKDSLWSTTQMAFTVWICGSATVSILTILKEYLGASSSFTPACFPQLLIGRKLRSRLRLSNYFTN